MKPYTKVFTLVVFTAVCATSQAQSDKTTFAISDIKPTLAGYKNRAVITCDKEAQTVWVECPDEPEAKVVLAKGGFWAMSMNDKDGSLTYRQSNTKILFKSNGTIVEPGLMELSQGTKILVAREEGIENPNVLCPAWDSPDWFIGNIDYIGSRYTLKGTVKLMGWTFESNAESPWIFELDKEKGFVYISGKGKLTSKDGKTTELGRSSKEDQSGAPSSTDAPEASPKPKQKDIKTANGIFSSKIKQTEDPRQLKQLLLQHPEMAGRIIPRLEALLVEQLKKSDVKAFTIPKFRPKSWPPAPQNKKWSGIWFIEGKRVIDRAVHFQVRGERWLISKHGPDSAQKLVRYQPPKEQKPFTGSLTIREGDVLLEYEGDSYLPFIETSSGGIKVFIADHGNRWGMTLCLFPEGEGSIHRYAGKVQRLGYTFINEGGAANRLTFVVTKEGYVYLRGKGRVIMKDKKQVKLGY